MFQHNTVATEDTKLKNLMYLNSDGKRVEKPTFK